MLAIAFSASSGYALAGARPAVSVPARMTEPTMVRVQLSCRLLCAATPCGWKVPPQ